MNNNEILKKVKENFKKKRGKWYFEVSTMNSMNEAYDKAKEILEYLDKSFSTDEKEKFSFNKIIVGVLPEKFIVSISFKR